MLSLWSDGLINEGENAVLLGCVVLAVSVQLTELAASLA